MFLMESQGWLSSQELQAHDMILHAVCHVRKGSVLSHDDQNQFPVQ